MDLITKIITRIKHEYHFFRWKQMVANFKKKNINVSIDSKVERSAILATKFGGSIYIDQHTEILEGAILMTYGGQITIGSNCSVNPYTIIYGHGKGVNIGCNVLIAGHTMIIPSNHQFGTRMKPICQQGENSKGIVIEDDVWIGHGCSILDGVTIGKGCIIAAGSVVTSNTLPFTIVGGIPAKTIKQRP